MGDDIREFAGFAGIRDQDHRILCGDHAKVAVAGLAGVNILRRRAGAGHGGGDLGGHMARFAHARHDHPPRHRQQEIDDRVEGGRQRVAHGGERGALDIQDIAGDIGGAGRGGHEGRLRLGCPRS